MGLRRIWIAYYLSDHTLQSLAMAEKPDHLDWAKMLEQAINVKFNGTMYDENENWLDP